MKKLGTLTASLALGLQAQAAVLGSAAPEVSAPWTGGEGEISPAHFKGQWLVIYFYPKSFTPGCTAQACSLRDEYSEIQQQGAVILGVSLDSVKKQQEFKAKYTLPFELVADEKKAWSRGFDALALGGLFAQRKTFIIHPEGHIAHVFEKAGTSNHSEEVLSILKKLQAKP